MEKNKGLIMMNLSFFLIIFLLSINCGQGKIKDIKSVTNIPCNKNKKDDKMLELLVIESIYDQYIADKKEWGEKENEANELKKEERKEVEQWGNSKNLIWKTGYFYVPIITDAEMTFPEGINHNTFISQKGGILPCCYCGSQPYIIRYGGLNEKKSYKIQCADCGGVESTKGTNYDAVILQWNKKNKRF